MILKEFFSNSSNDLPFVSGMSTKTKTIVIKQNIPKMP